MSLAIWSLLPELGNIHGDAGNADVLAVRARWCGVDAEVVEVAAGAPTPTREPDLVVVGSGFDADAERIRDGLLALRPAIVAALERGVPLLAVGLGWELLSAGVELDGGALEGLGVFPGRAVAAERRTGDLVVDTTWGRLVGYEYHLRDYAAAAGERALGTVDAGIGRVAGVGLDGSVVGTAHGTALRGPVLARNGGLADHLLRLAATRRGITLGDGGGQLARVDAWNAAIAERTTRALGLR